MAIVAAFLLVVALAVTGVPGHGHDPDAQDGSHTDCEACHFRHLLVVETGAAPAPTTPDLVAHPIPYIQARCEQGAALGIRSTRGPPA